MTFRQKIDTLVLLSCNEELTKFYKLQANKVMLGMTSEADAITAINDEITAYKGDSAGQPMWVLLSESYLNDQPGPDAYKFEPDENDYEE